MSDNVIADWLVMGVNVSVNAVILAGWLAIMGLFAILNNTVSEQEAQNIRLEEYREYNQYDHTHVYAQDVMTAIYQYRGAPAVKVSSSCGTFEWSLTSIPCEYKTVQISPLIDQTMVYDADIEYGLNGEVVALVFRSCAGYCGR